MEGKVKRFADRWSSKGVIRGSKVGFSKPWGDGKENSFAGDEFCRSNTNSRWVGISRESLVVEERVGGIRGGSLSDV